MDLWRVVSKREKGAASATFFLVPPAANNDVVRFWKGDLVVVVDCYLQSFVPVGGAVDVPEERGRLLQLARQAGCHSESLQNEKTI